MGVNIITHQFISCVLERNSWQSGWDFQRGPQELRDCKSWNKIENRVIQEGCKLNEKVVLDSELKFFKQLQEKK